MYRNLSSFLLVFTMAFFVLPLFGFPRDCLRLEGLRALLSFAGAFLLFYAQLFAEENFLFMAQILVRGEISDIIQVK
jgi:hypothetical protein